MVSDMCEDCQDKGRHDREQEMKEMTRKMVAAITNRETQRHFIRAGMEMVMGFDALLRNMPMTDEMKAVLDKSTEYMSFVSKEICAVNPNCSQGRNDSEELEKIDLG